MRIDPTLALTVATVIEEGTLDAAAHRLHLTPSAVSQRLRNLEEHLGQRLVVRSKPVRATEAGQAVLRYARRFALLEHELTEELGLEAPSARPRISVAVNADSLATWFLEPLARFADRHDVEVDLHRADQDHTARLLETGTVAAAVTSQARPVPGCHSTPLGSLVYEAVAAPAWIDRWAPDGLGPEIFARAPRVDYDPHDTLQSDWLAHHGIAAHEAPRHLVPSTHDFARGVELGLGWGVIPVQQAGPRIAGGRLRALGGPQIPVSLHWQRWKGTSVLLDALTTAVVSEAHHRLLTS